MIGIVIAIIVVLAIIFLIISEKIFERTNYFAKNYADPEKLKGDGKVDFVNTGSTFAYYGIDYHTAGVRGLNLALCPQSLAYDFKMLKHYEYRYNKGAAVFIVISDLAFAKTDYTETSITDKYYKIFERKEIEDYNPLKAIRAKYLPVLYNWKNFLRFYRDIGPDNEYELKVNENDREAVEADAFKRCREWIQEFKFEDLSDSSQGRRFSSAFSYTTGIVSEMVDWCKAEGFKPVIVNLPVSSEMGKSFSKEFLDAFYYDNIDKIEGAEFIDLQKKSELSDYLLYIDSCRLNKAGREIITKLLLREIGQTKH